MDIKALKLSSFTESLLATNGLASTAIDHPVSVQDRPTNGASSIQIELNSKDSKIYWYTLNHFVRGVSENWKRTPTALISKGALALGGAFGRIPFLPISFRAGQGNLAAGAFYAATNLICFSSYYVWASIKMVNRVAVSVQSAEKIGSDKHHRCARIGMIFSAVIAGTGAQIPAYVLAYDNNRAYPAILALNIFDEILPIYSMDMVIQNQIVKNPYFFTELEKQIFGLKQEVISRIQKKYIDYIRNVQERTKINAFLSDLSTSSAEEHEKMTQLVEFLIEPLSIIADPTPSSTAYRYATASAQAVGLSLTVVQLAWAGYLAYIGMDQVSGNSDAAIALAVYVGLCSLALTQFLLVNTCVQTVVSAGQLLKRQPLQTFISEELYPRVSIGIKGFCIANALFTAVVATQMSKDYLREDLQIPSAVLYSTSYVISSYFPIRELSDWMMQEWTIKLGSPEEKHFVSIAHQISNLSEFIDSASVKSVAKFLLPFADHPVTAGILTKYKLDKKVLSALLNLSSTNEEDS